MQEFEKISGDSSLKLKDIKAAVQAIQRKEDHEEFKAVIDKANSPTLKQLFAELYQDKNFYNDKLGKATPMPPKEP